MNVTLKQAFSILDGRLTTDMDDVYSMLSYIFGVNLFTHELPSAMKALQETNPKWFQEGKDLIDGIKKANNTNDFVQLMKIIDEQFSDRQIILQKI